MSEELLLRHCSPTLAALKAGNMFSCPYGSMQKLEQMVQTWNARLNSKGVEILILSKSSNTALIYVYRPALLAEELQKQESKDLLTTYGYPVDTPQASLSYLSDKLLQQGGFPHEIGLFLGYPPTDVRLFIENKGCNGKCDGCWKVYANELEAKQRFAQFKKCTALYIKKYKEGKPLDSLAVRKVSL